MQVLRPIQNDDFDALKQIAVESGHGFTSLPVDDQALNEKIASAQGSFVKSVDSPEQEKYLFVLEDSKTGEILGTTGINAAVGLESPIYHYRLRKTAMHSSRLGLTNSVETMRMCNDYTGTSEICTLFLRQAYRNGHAGRFLSRVRFLFMAQHPQRFAETIIAEMRGVSCEQGESPFWQWLKKHFIDIDFPTVDYMVGTGNMSFVPQLMPKYPIYTSTLSQDAREVIGKVHDKTKPALRMLEKEGFKHKGYVDLFDAGPTIESRLNEIKTVKHSNNAPVEISEVESDQVFAVCNNKVADFRATYTKGISQNQDDGSISISPEVASALKVTSGESVRFVAL